MRGTLQHIVALTQLFLDRREINFMQISVILDNDFGKFRTAKQQNPQAGLQVWRQSAHQAFDLL